MAHFLIRAIAPNGDVRHLGYDNQTSSLTWEDGSPVVEVKPKVFQDATVVCQSLPGQKSDIKVLKISLGLSCNYECNYCSQRFVPHAEQTNPQDVDRFIQQLTTAVQVPPERIEFWGGEPLVYIKTLQPLANQLRAIYPKAQFHLITNGSLLNAEINAWLEMLDFCVAISHDGPGYHARGLDPLDDPNQHAAVMDLYARLHPKGRISINAMMSRHNPSRAAVQHWLQTRFGADVPIGEGAFIDPYDDGGLGALFRNPQEHILFRRQAFDDLRSGAASQFDLASSKTMDFVNSIRQGRPASSLGQKCNMDRSDHIAVDLKGRVVTCQNVSAVSRAPNGESHAIGTLADLSKVQMKSSTHWRERKDCSSCPVLQLCKGSCMFLDGPLWNAACAASYSDNIAFFAFGITLLTGHVPIYIEGDFPQDRKDIFGVVQGLANDVPNVKPKTNRVIPIRAI
jgi:uncharacterized protein